MNQGASSQWDFGELFGPTAARRVLSVHELTLQIRQLLERSIGKVWVTGEVSNFRLQSSGHAYFTLKDGGAQIQCVVFRGDAVAGREWLKDGQKLIMRGELTVYEPRGQYQLRVLAAEPQGVGALQLAYERLRRQLQTEGLFEAARKRKLPVYPQRIGIVTSLSGAALRDVVHVIRRRQPGLELVLAACRVQGTGAAAEIARAIQWLNEWSANHPDAAVELILVTRGGGSLEDLWAFNEEIVARAVFHSRLPVISAVGHEIDFTICDFVADVRAATPSAAAELITEGAFGKRQYLAETALYLRQLCAGRLSRRREQLREVVHRFGREHPRRIWQRYFQHLDELEDGMGRCARHHWRRHHARGSNLQQRLARLRPAAILRRRRDRVDELAFRLQQAQLVKFDRLRRRAEQACLKLRLLSPEQILRRGYSITTDAASGSVIRSVDEVRAGQNLRTRLHHGAVHSTVIPGGDQGTKMTR